MLIAENCVFFWLLVHSTGPEQRDTHAKQNLRTFLFKRTDEEAERTAGAGNGLVQRAPSVFKHTT